MLSTDASIDAVARAMHMSPRTLQRRLDEEGARFSELLDSVRETLARRWLTEETRTLSEIGYALGFADLATFSRAFKRWTGKPPGATAGAAEDHRRKWSDRAATTRHSPINMTACDGIFREACKQRRCVIAQSP